MERLSGLPFDQFCEQHIFRPLGMRDTHFRRVKPSHGPPPPSLRVVPTEVDQSHRGRLLWGEVHDPCAYLLGGVAGHAGLFSTAADVCTFARQMLAALAGSPGAFVKTDTARLFCTATPATRHNPRPFALGFDVASRTKNRAKGAAGTLLSKLAFGHTGYVGTSLWICPVQKTWVVLLTNSCHPRAWRPSGEEILRVRPRVADACVTALAEEERERRKAPRSVRNAPPAEPLSQRNGRFVGSMLQVPLLPFRMPLRLVTRWRRRCGAAGDAAATETPCTLSRRRRLRRRVGALFSGAAAGISLGAAALLAAAPLRA